MADIEKLVRSLQYAVEQDPPGIDDQAGRILDNQRLIMSGLVELLRTLKPPKEMSSEVWNSLNKLLAFLEGGTFDVPKLVDDYYLVKYKNAAPGELLRRQIKECQELLDKYKPY